MIIYRIRLAEAGHRIRCLCERHNLTPIQLHKMLFLESPQSVYHWYYGKALPQIDNFYNLSVILNTSINDILVVEPIEISKEDTV